MKKKKGVMSDKECHESCLRMDDWLKIHKIKVIAEFDVAEVIRKAEERENKNGQR